MQGYGLSHSYGDNLANKNKTRDTQMYAEKRLDNSFGSIRYHNKKYCKYTLIFYWKLSQQILHINIVIHNSPLNGCIKESRLGGAFDGTVNTNDIPKILEMKNAICLMYELIGL